MRHYCGPVIPILIPAGHRPAVSVDWNEVAALATVGLAVLTLVLAIAAIRAAVLTKRGIDAQLQAAADDVRAMQEAQTLAQHQIEMSQRQIEASHRPLLIDVPPEGPAPYTPETAAQITPAGMAPSVRLEWPGGLHYTANVDPRRLYVDLDGPRAWLAVPLRNVGTGLAVIDAEDVKLIGLNLFQRVMSEPRPQQVPAGETTHLLLRWVVSTDYLITCPWLWELFVPYRDFAGGQATVALVEIERFSEDGWRIRNVKQRYPEDIAP